MEIKPGRPKSKRYIIEVRQPESPTAWVFRCTAKNVTITYDRNNARVFMEREIHVAERACKQLEGCGILMEV